MNLKFSFKFALLHSAKWQKAIGEHVKHKSQYQTGNYCPGNGV